MLKCFLSQSLFYWIIYSYAKSFSTSLIASISLNPYFIGLSILIRKKGQEEFLRWCLNPYFIGLSILIIGIIFYISGEDRSLNPYFIGLSILILDGTGGISFYVQKSQSLFYWIIYSYIAKLVKKHKEKKIVSILILLDYLFLFCATLLLALRASTSQSLFYWIIYSYTLA